MRNTTHDNYLNRYNWLEQALELKTHLSKAEIQGIASMRDFCSLEVKGHFTKISLNTLKSAAGILDQNTQNRNSWETIKTMRAKLFALHTPQSTKNSAPLLPPQEEQLRVAFLESHIISMAYYDLFNFLNLLAAQKSQDANQILASIDLKIKTSTAKYQKYLCTHKATSTENLQLIQGGKPSD